MIRICTMCNIVGMNGVKTLSQRWILPSVSSSCRLYSHHNQKPGRPTYYQNLEARKVEFSPSRSRDIAGSNLEAQNNPVTSAVQPESPPSVGKDEHVDSYDCRGSVSLSSVMQTNVPEPFTSEGKGVPSHLNMPGGQWGQGEKFLSGDLQDVHYRRHTGSVIDNRGTSPIKISKGRQLGNMNFSLPNRFIHTCNLPINYPTLPTALAYRHRKSFDYYKLTSQYYYSDNAISSDKTQQDSPSGNGKLTRKQQLKRAVKDYGVTVVIFHVTMSLASLGGFYLLVSSGLDVAALLSSLGVGAETSLQKAIATGASTFVIAYAVHKVFAPVRIGITLTLVPFIVKYLRKIRFLKPPG